MSPVLTSSEANSWGTMQEESIDQASEQTEIPAEAPAEIVSDEPAQQEAADEVEKPRDDKGRFKPSVQQRIDELTKARHEAEREAAYWRERAGTEQQGISAKSAEKPTADQYSDYSEYVEALADWKAGQKVAEALSQQSAKQAQRSAQTAQEITAQQWQERQSQVAKQIPDFEKVMASANIPVSPAVQQSILESDVGPQIAYTLAKNPDEAARISALSPLAAAREIGKIEAKLQSVASAPKASKAPEPISPVKGGTTRNASNDPSKMSHEEYRAMRAKQGARWAK